MRQVFHACPWCASQGSEQNKRKTDNGGRSSGGERKSVVVGRGNKERKKKGIENMERKKSQAPFFFFFIRDAPCSLDASPSFSSSCTCDTCRSRQCRSRSLSSSRRRHSSLTNSSYWNCYRQWTCEASEHKRETYIYPTGPCRSTSQFCCTVSRVVIETSLPTWDAHAACSAIPTQSWWASKSSE